ncbi:MAG: ATP-binding cassette domain-containing protein [Bacteroidota bacterium]
MEKHGNILEVEGVSRSFGKKAVLNKVTFHMGRGEICSIVGENGSGKTTLIRIIVGMIRAEEGHVRIHGNFGYCPQDMQVFNTLTLRENLTYFSTAYGMPGKASVWNGNLQQLTEDLKLSGEMDTMVAKLSGGTRQKLNLILALLHSPELLILDEPYAAFDWESYLYFWRLVSALKEKGSSFLIVSHLIYDQKNIDRIFELKDGRLQ